MNDILKAIFTYKVTIALYILLIFIGLYLTIVIVRSVLKNTTYLKYKVLNGVNNFEYILKKNNDKNKFQDIRRFSRTYDFKLSMIEKLEIRFIDKPTLKNIVPFVNIYLLLMFAFILFLIGFWMSYLKLYFIPASIVFGSMFSLIFFLGIDIRTKINNENIRKIMATFVATLNKYASIKEDVVYVLEKSISVTPEPLKTYVDECVIQIKNGLNEIEALEILSMKVDSEQFKDFVVNLQQSRKHRGDLKKLLTNLEEEFYTLEEEFNRRKITTFTARIRIYIFMGGIAGAAYLFIENNPTVKEYYMATPIGKSILTVFMLIYVLAFVYSTTITDFNY